MSMSPLFLIEQRSPSPIVISIPHGGEFFPGDLTQPVLRTSDLWADWYTNELFDFLTELDVGMVVANYSRFVADPNRDPDGQMFGSFWDSVVPAVTPKGEQVYDQPLDETELQRRVELVHHPYHQLLRHMVDRAVATHGRALVLDLHSFGMPVDADVIIGDGNGALAGDALVSILEGQLQHEGFSSVRNHRFTGGWIVKQFANEPNVESVQIELNQRRYLHVPDVEQMKPRPARTDQYFATRGQLRNVFRGVIDEIGHGV